jgi:D-arabinose 1-dehydrogenase-like Zn-dependent alcohol dehydrogenase
MFAVEDRRDDIRRQIVQSATVAVAKTGTPAAFFSDEDGRDIQAPLVGYVADFVQVAAGAKSSLSVAWLTAWRMVVTKARLRKGETVLIFGIGGSVSLAATQIASALDARTIVTSRDATKLERARAFGADETIQDQGGSSIVDRVMEITGKRGVDVVIENIGKAVWPSAMRALVRGGRLQRSVPFAP